MKIAMIHPFLTTSTGGERLLLKLAIGLQKKGHEVEIFVNGIDREKCFPELLKEVRVRVVSCGLNIPLVSFYRALGGMLKIGRSISGEFDIINNHNFPSEWAAFFAKKRLKIPIVWMCNEPPHWFLYSEARRGVRKIINWPLFEILDKIAVCSIDKIVAMSRLDQKLIKRIYNKPSVLIREGVDADFLQRGSGENFRKKYGLKNDFLILQVGTLIYYKHPDCSIEALARLSKKYTNLKLVFIGTGEVRRYKEFSRKLGIENRVLFLSNLNEKELADTYQACNVLIFPAEQTWGLVVAEAMAASKPVIVSNRAGVSEIISQGVDGVIVSHLNSVEIAKYLEKLINSPQLCKKLGENARRYVKENLSWENYIENMEKVFRETIYQNKE